MRRIRGTIVCIVASFLASQVLFALLPKAFELWNAQLTDRLFRLRSAVPSLEPPYDPTIVHVDLNDTSLRELDNFYINRSRIHYATLIRNLASMGTAAQAYDLLFAARMEEAEDRQLMDATAGADNVYFGMVFELSEEGRGRMKGRRTPEGAAYLERTGWTLQTDGSAKSFYEGSPHRVTFPDLASLARGGGFISIKEDGDGVMRRVPLLVRSGGKYYPSLPFKVVCDHLQVPPERIRVASGRIVLEGARRTGAPPRDITIPVDGHGNMVINFIGPWERMTHYHFVDVYQASESDEELARWRKELKDKIVVVSEVATGSTDIGPVPTDLNFPLSGLHANVMHTILTGSFLQTLSPAEMVLIEVGVSAVIVGISLSFTSLWFTLGLAILGVLYAGLGTASFLWGGILPSFVRPLVLLGMAAVSVNGYRYVQEEQEKRVLKTTFEAYFPPAVVKKIMANPQLIATGGGKKELTILFSDIKDFTLHTSTRSPDEIRRALNEYFDAMVEIVFQYEGTVDKYIGDGLMVFFGDPEPLPDHALRGVRAAMAMQQKARELKARWERDAGIPLVIRIGVNTGEVVVGNMGSAKRLSYTVLGAAVNLAQRLETNARPGGILISQRTYALLGNQITARALDPLTVKGFASPIHVYEVEVGDR